MLLSNHDSDFLKRVIFEYMEWCKNQDESSSEDDKQRWARALEALEDAFPECCFGYAVQNPILGVGIEKLREINENAKQHAAGDPSFLWDDYYAACKSLAEHQTFPPDSLDPRGFLCWCVHQRRVFNRFHRKKEEESSVKEEIMSLRDSHLNSERIKKLNALNFQWDRPETEKSHLIKEESRRPQSSDQIARWYQLLEEHKPHLARRKAKAKTGDEEFCRRAEDWLECQIQRYRDWDAGFVDFTFEQRAALDELGLLPVLKASGDIGSFFRRHGEAEVFSEEEEEDDDSDSSNAVLSMLSRKRKESTATTVESETSEAPQKKEHSKIKKLTWEERFEELKAFREQHGHTRVTHSQDKSLATWVKKQRVKLRHNRGRFPRDRKAKLDSIDFVWNVKVSKTADGKPLPGTREERDDEIWFDRLKQLKEYHKKYGHFDVPRYAPKNTLLANWVRHSRENVKKPKFPKHRLQALEDIGFCVPKSSRKKMTTPERESNRLHSNSPSPTRSETPDAEPPVQSSKQKDSSDTESESEYQSLPRSKRKRDRGTVATVEPVAEEGALMDEPSKPGNASKRSRQNGSNNNGTKMTASLDASQDTRGTGGDDDKKGLPGVTIEKDNVVEGHGDATPVGTVAEKDPDAEESDTNLLPSEE